MVCAANLLDFLQKWGKEKRKKERSFPFSSILSKIFEGEQEIYWLAPRPDKDIFLLWKALSE
jgi:hypothetical protein